MAVIIEVRNYRIHSGRREEFIGLFMSELVPELRSFGIKVLGPLLDVENPDRFTWLRSFPSLEERDRMIEAFHNGAKWKNGLREVLVSMVANHEVTLCETPDDMVADGLG